jgi:hypothetical protein
MASKFHSSLSNDFSLMLNDADDHNVIIQVGENQNTRNFVHIQIFLELVHLILKVHYRLDGLLKIIII